jgi:uncharacterized protein
MSTSDRPQIFISVIALGMSLIACSIVLARGMKGIRGGQQTVVVTGSAKKRIRSDFATWRTVVRSDGAQLAQAYRALTQDVPKVKAYLLAKGIPENQIVVSAIRTTTVRERRGIGSYQGDQGEAEASGRVIGYSLQQDVEVRSNDVDKIAALSRQVTELINQGMLIESVPPEYLSTKLGDLKIEMLAEAAKDAKLRAQQIADATGSKIGPVQAARMGVLQITPPGSNVVTDYGVNDTSSIEKDITAVVNITFAVD